MRSTRPHSTRPLINLATLTLATGGHNSPAAGMCMVEAASYIAGEVFSDSPQCVSPVIAAFCRSWNDALPEPPRTQLLRPLIAEIIGTRTTDEDDAARAWMATDWLVRVQAPAWLRLAGLTSHAQALEATARIVNATTARSAQATLDAASYAAREAVVRAAREAVSEAARDAASYAARYAAREAVSYAARDAARDAASYAANYAAREAVSEAASYAASYAANYAAREAHRYAAREAASKVLAPTVEHLQASAVHLLRAMCAVGRTEVVS